MVTEHFDQDRARYLQFRKSSSCAHKLDYHIVIPTKYRRLILEGPLAERVLASFQEVCSKNGYLLLGASILPEHVHILLGLPPKVAVSEAVKNLKGASTSEARRVYPDIVKLWADGYSVETLGKANVAQVKAYLDRQKGHHLP